ncbi:MAG TPA: terminase, partial [Methyloradius sp.]
MLTKREQVDLVKFLAEFTNDPLGFVYASFKWGEGELEEYDGPDDWQIEQLKYIRDRLRAGKMDSGQAISYVIQLAIASGHGIGKSALVGWIILWAISTFEDAKGVVTANTESQLKTKTWAELAKWHRLFIGKALFDYQATSLSSIDPDHEKTWRIDMIPWSERNTEAFAGLHNKGKRILIVFDEASAIPDVIWEVTEGALSDANTQILWLAFGNPTRNTGRFKDCFTHAARRKRWHSAQIDSRTVKMTNKDLINQQVEEYGIDSDFIKVRVRGMFPSMSVKQFISVADVDKAFGKHLRPEQYNFAPKIITCDPAWEGDDELVIALRQGLAFSILRTMPKNDNDVHVANILANLEDEHRADVV